MRVLVLDNYDSFTYNLVHMLREMLDVPVDVYRNDKISIEQATEYEKILLSPGPGVPSEAGIMPELVSKLAVSHSILGVCLGHQCIAEQFGARLDNLQDVVHGKPADIVLTDPQEILFAGLDQTFQAGRYHSWVVNKESLPPEIKITAETNDGIIMAIRHATYDLRGIQFHPESVMTPNGKKMLANWLKIEEV